ncbi:MAG: hypothetical protein QXT06_01620, partial [Candidatus Bathyarchaeia archaeon]
MVDANKCELKFSPTSPYVENAAFVERSIDALTLAVWVAYHVILHVPMRQRRLLRMRTETG